MKKKTILIFGVSSFVGSNLAEYFKRDYRVIGTYFKNKVKIDGVLTFPCDVLKKSQIQTAIYTFRPDLTIYAVGLSSLDDCYHYPKLADALNAVGVFNVSGFSERYRSRFCFISSSYIFPGHNVVYKENDTPMPGTVYGNTLASSEFYVQKSCLNYLIFRCCPLYGRSYNNHQLNFFELLERRYAEGKTLTCDNKVFTGHLDIYYLSRAIQLALEADIRNRLFQLTSKDYGTYFNFAKTYAKVFGKSEGSIQKGDWDFPAENLRYAIKMIDTENYFYKMNQQNLETTLNFEMPTIEESLKFTKLRLGSTNQMKKKNTKAAGVSFI
ncbi:MAG: sugar nucleotide-binding protein [Bacteriovoracaceae bacterium]|nr:sugar nucleotide-binding protein [Bacteriovoracaceae bacterium]